MENQNITIVDKITKRFKELFNKANAFVIILNGEWGVGKTHFWNNFCEAHLTDKKVAYISLFGKESIQEIRSDIIIQISKKDLLISKSRVLVSNIKSAFGYKGEDITFGVTGAFFSTLMTIFTKKDFENVIVCFDDFERISDDLKIKDVLGLISELKEQKNCKVIMILNKNELNTDDNEILSTYKDKIISYEFKYEPKAIESFELVKQDLKYFHSYLVDYIKRKNIVNIRIISRIIDSLNDFSFIYEHIVDNSFIEREIIENIIEISTINSINMSVDFHKLSQYTMDKSINTYNSIDSKEFKLDKTFEALLGYIDNGHDYFNISDITEYMIDYIKNSFIDEELLIKIIKQRKKEMNKEEIRNIINTLYDKFNYNLKYKTSEFVSDLYKIFQENKDNLQHLISSNNFIFYMNKLKQLDSSKQDKYHIFAVEVLEKYLLGYLESDEHYGRFKIEELNNIKNYDSSLQQYVDDFENRDKESQIDSIEKIIEILNKPIVNSGWGDEPKLLSSISKEKCKEYILESSEYLEATMDLIKYIGRFSSDTGFEPFIKNNIEVFEEIRDDGKKDHKIKMNKILDYIDKN